MDVLSCTVVVCLCHRLLSEKYEVTIPRSKVRKLSLVATDIVRFIWDTVGMFTHK